MTTKVPTDNSNQFEQTKLYAHVTVASLLTLKATVATLNENSTIRQGLEKMRFHGYSAIPVLSDDGDYIGTLTEGDLLWHLIDDENNSLHDQEKGQIRDIIRKSFNPAATIDTPLKEVLLKVMDQNFVPVVDDRHKFVGIITRKTIIKYYADRSLS